MEIQEQFEVLRSGACIIGCTIHCIKISIIDMYTLHGIKIYVHIQKGSSYLVKHFKLNLLPPSLQNPESIEKYCCEYFCDICDRYSSCLEDKSIDSTVTGPVHQTTKTAAEHKYRRTDHLLFNRYRRSRLWTHLMFTSSAC